jgi:hypothetical protein
MPRGRDVQGGRSADVTLGSVDLEKQPANINGRELQFRKLTIEPGGILP